MTHHVYTFWDTETRRPLYVGCTGSLRQRMAAHRGTPWDCEATWIGVVAFEDADEAFSAEADYIRKSRPVYNHDHNWRSRSVIEVEALHEAAELYRADACYWPASATSRKRESLRQLAAKYKAEAGAA